MPSSYQNPLAQDTGNSKIFSSLAKPELSPLLKNISIAALVGVIALTVISSLIVASSSNYLDQNNNLKTEKTSHTPKLI